MVLKHQHFHETPPEVEVEFPPSATLEGAVSDALASAGGVDASDVAVIARGSEITLSGTVQLESEIARAEDVALNVAGVTTVRNELRFNRPM
ncbi:Putative periplasmic or secreted lipoprotein [Neorhizobium galegae bv. officinalis bv. officinalis str. HAMBI 1141]|jgi:osmotically-inducible protein OsmY|uniref:Putative periplasmic or secreted lipoprotein n=1 Tax=Neorhizobium galegae bv. officinalis bv. officinalis str. HAMBI 1141 TaxID=1028801 RepID=A0A068TBR9_NEOGA|nr:MULTISPECIES: BON domain-containing protein [Neorhizobium]MCJ9669238.1 BON domain-containing protein [Neorhizobium sp. SHOUNA12B]MCJ9742898.1 BON domain-containing protein [Neorhizobium sp. SHOUNA12A]MCJ9750855.1 BON domain-containing protein [Neorhizobium sp. BETTINA12A]CDN55554.1 Putative periplasmic or secreted lipoprotein [Neorhizobium galegae bv. officinalis bv. officinalis str. HAMBI 1141]